MPTLADLQAAETTTEAPVQEAHVLPANVVFDVELTKLGTDKARTRYMGEMPRHQSSPICQASCPRC